MNDQNDSPQKTTGSVKNSLQSADKDVAWASIETPLCVDELLVFCKDIERLYRINPMLTFKSWQEMASNKYQFSGENISQDESFQFDISLTVEETTDGAEISYQQGIKSSTHFKIEPLGNESEYKSKLTITESYAGMSEQARKENLHTVDRSLTVWAKYLQQYLISWQRWSHSVLWRWYMKRIWQPMNPSGRRITYMLLWITLFEIALISLGVAIYFLEYS